MTRKESIEWLKAPHTDSAEYKMWGNGIALPCTVFILEQARKAYDNERD